MSGHQIDQTTVGLGEAGIVPRCACGGEWVDGDCIFRNSFVGAAWELGQAKTALWQALRYELGKVWRRVRL